MAVRRGAQTQTESYWRREFRIRPEDVEAIYDLMLEEGRPRALDDLVCEVMARHCRREAQARRPEQAMTYRPREHYAVGQQIVFPGLDYAVGQVVAERPGVNPRYGDFTVISVAFDGQGQVREYAADLAVPHALNETPDEAACADAEQLTPEELCRRYGDAVRGPLSEALSAVLDFVHADGTDEWFLRGLLPQVHVGHLNLAEAVVDVAGHPLSTEEILQQVDLAAESKPEARHFALNLALSDDGRFDNVGLPSRPRWFLYHLEPPAVAAKPDRLVPSYPTTGSERVHRESLEIAEEIGDELDDLPGVGRPPAALDTGKASYVLSYAHRQSGTFPLTRETRALFPSEEYARIPIHLVDGRTDSRWMGWVLPKEGYGWGLGDWYAREEVPAGATVELLSTRDPYSVVVQCEMRSRRTEWVRVPRIENNRLTFEIRKRAYTCRYDRNLLLGEPSDTTRLDEVRLHYRTAPISLFQAILQVFPELAKLGSQGLVHAKALYASINVTWRVGAIPIFAELARHACFDPVGGGNWAFDDSLVEATYATAEEMEARPLSKRVDLIRDRVVSYGSPA